MSTNKVKEFEEKIWNIITSLEHSSGNTIRVNETPIDLPMSLHEYFRITGSTYHYKYGSLYKIEVKFFGNNIIIEENDKHE